MNLNYLPYFIELAQDLNFSLTAKRLLVAQPAVSKAIKNLEEQLGVDLFLRTNKKVELTHEGHELYEKVAPLYAELSGIMEQVKTSQSFIQGTIRIGTLFELGNYLIAPIINSFLAQFDHVQFELIYKGDKELVEMLKKGDLDFIFGISSFSQESYLSLPMCKQSSFLLTSSKTKIDTNQKIQDKKFIVYRKDDPLLKAYLQRFYPKTHFELINKSLVVNSHDAMIQLLEQNPGFFAVLPELSRPVSEAMKSKQIKLVNKNKLQSDIYFSYWDKDNVSAKDKTFINFIKDWKKKNG